MITAVSPGLSAQEMLDKYLFSETVPLTFSFLSTSSGSAGRRPVPALAPVPHEARGGEGRRKHLGLFTEKPFVWQERGEGRRGSGRGAG